MSGGQYGGGNVGTLIVHTGVGSGTLDVNTAEISGGQITFGADGSIFVQNVVFGAGQLTGLASTAFNITSNNTIIFESGTATGGIASNATNIYVNCNLGVYTIMNTGTGFAVYQPPMTPEQAAEAERARIEMEEKWKREERLREKAEAKAEKLLRELAGRKLFELYKQRGYFEVIGSSGRRYRFRKQQRVQIMKEIFGDAVDYELCVINAGAAYVPPSDMLITLMLLVLSGEDGENLLHEKGNRRAAA
jgi:hypothetical protein